MSRQRGIHGEKNIIAPRLIALRQAKGLSQRALAGQLQVAGLDVDKNMITRIETQKRYVTDMEIRAIALFFEVSYEFLLNGTVGGSNQTELLASARLARSSDEKG